jgi:hypothetical protein
MEHVFHIFTADFGELLPGARGARLLTFRLSKLEGRAGRLVAHLNYASRELALYSFEDFSGCSYTVYHSGLFKLV